MVQCNQWDFEDYVNRTNMARSSPWHHQIFERNGVFLLPVTVKCEVDLKSTVVTPCPLSVLYNVRYQGDKQVFVDYLDRLMMWIPDRHVVGQSGGQSGNSRPE